MFISIFKKTGTSLWTETDSWRSLTLCELEAFGLILNFFYESGSKERVWLDAQGSQTKDILLENI